MPLSDLRSSLFARDHQTLDEKVAMLSYIGSESPEALELAEVRALCRYIRDELEAKESGLPAPAVRSRQR